MKIGNPIAREKVKLPKGAYVLDVGGGHNPNPRAHVVIDKYTDSQNLHRSGNLRILKNQKFLAADAEDMPFGDKEFDYVFCCQVLEHAEHPEIFLNELARVGKRGYLELPTLIGEYLAPKASHRWVGLELNHTIVLFSKESIHFSLPVDLGELFAFYLPKHSMGYKIIQREHPAMFNIGYEWQDSIDYIINPSQEELRRLFTEAWLHEDCKWVCPSRPLWREFLSSICIIFQIMWSVFQSKLLARIVKKTSNHVVFPLSARSEPHTPKDS